MVTKSSSVRPVGVESWCFAFLGLDAGLMAFCMVCLVVNGGRNSRGVMLWRCGRMQALVRREHWAKTMLLRRTNWDSRLSSPHGNGVYGKGRCDGLMLDFLPGRWLGGVYCPECFEQKLWITPSYTVEVVRC